MRSIKTRLPTLCIGIFVLWPTCRIVSSLKPFFFILVLPLGVEFKANTHLTDPKEIDFCIRLADTNLDTVLVQSEHLSNLMKDPNYMADV